MVDVAVDCMSLNFHCAVASVRVDHLIVVNAVVVVGLLRLITCLVFYFWYVVNFSRQMQHTLNLSNNKKPC